MVFYARVLAYFSIIVGLPLLLAAHRESLPNFLLSYGIFMFFVVLINHVDYAFPSYKRYLRLLRDGKWGVNLTNGLGSSGR